MLLCHHATIGLVRLTDKEREMYAEYGQRKGKGKSRQLHPDFDEPPFLSTVSKYIGLDEDYAR